MRPVPLGAAVLAVAALAAPARAQLQAYEALGTAPIAGGDAVRARAEALEGAIRRAVEQAAAQAAPEVRGRFYLVSARARDFVPTYRILEEGEAGGQFQLRVSAQVDLPRLLRALQSSPAPRPAAGARGQLLLCAAEADAAPLLSALQGALAARVEVTSAGCPPPGEAPSPAAGAAGVLLVRAPVDLGRTARVRGTAPAIYGAAARVQIELLGGAPRGAGDRPRLEEAAEATEFGATPAEALAAAGRAAGERALQRVLPQLGALLPPPPGEGVVVTVEGVEGYGQYQLLLRTLSAMPGVAGAEPRRFGRPPGAAPTDEPRGDGQIEILLRTAQPAEPLGAAIGRTPIQGLRMQVMPQDARRLRLLVVRDSALPAAPPPDPGSAAPGAPGAPGAPAPGAPAPGAPAPGAPPS